MKLRFEAPGAFGEPWVLYGVLNMSSLGYRV